MRIKQIDDKNLVTLIRQKIKQNNGYCPCKVEHIPQNKCICHEFLYGTEKTCHCGLYIRVQE